MQDWKSRYDIDFTPLAEFVRNTPQMFLVKPYSARAWQTLSEPVLLADVDLKTVTNLEINNTTTVTATASGRLDGVLVYFELELGPTTRFSTHPMQVDEHNHWRSPVWVFSDAFPLQAGESFAVNYTHGLRGTESQVTVSHVGG